VTTARKIIFSIAVLAEIICIWYWLYNAQLLPYDDNYGALIDAFLVSLLATVVLSFMWFKQRPWILQSLYLSIVWMVLGSPVTVIVVVFYVYDILGIHLQT
jgi:hypothetical protein